MVCDYDWCASAAISMGLGNQRSWVGEGGKLSERPDIADRLDPGVRVGPLKAHQEDICVMEDINDPQNP